MNSTEINWVETRTAMPVYVCQTSTDNKHYEYKTE